MRSLVKFDDVLQEQLKNPEFKKCFDEAGAEYATFKNAMEARKEAGLTQVQMAEILGIEGRTYQRLEITEVLPPARHLVALAAYYNVSVDYILGRTDKREINR